jgi:fibrillarin-like rRNA methylase
MPDRSSFVSERRHPSLWSREEERFRSWWIETLGSLPPTHGERWGTARGHTVRHFDPHRSKLAAALVRGWEGDLPAPGERWLYLGAASGTTASYVADLTGLSGRVYAIERSLRPMGRLLGVAERWPNLLPILADARTPEEYVDWVPSVDGIYVDISQPDQVEILRQNARYFLAPRGRILFALKASSIDRSLSPPLHARRAAETLSSEFRIETSLPLAPFHRAHYFFELRRAPSSSPRRHAARR